MRVLVTGARGMLGRTLVRELGEFELVPTDLEVDVTDAAQVDTALARHRPSCVIHCAAMTAVDRCESERELAFRVNAEGSGNVARACARHDARLIAVSTDYVFRGDAARPYTEADPADGGRTVYGQSKFAGEQCIRHGAPGALIIRVAWLYGHGGPSFVHTMLALADGSRPTLKVVSDQRGNPTSALAVARHVRLLLLRPELEGIFHLTCEGDATWYDLACEVFRLKGIPQKVAPCSTAEYPRPAPRPADTRLDNQRLRQCGLPPMPHWKEALEEFLGSLHDN